MVKQTTYSLQFHYLWLRDFLKLQFDRLLHEGEDPQFDFGAEPYIEPWNSKMFWHHLPPGKVCVFHQVSVRVSTACRLLVENVELDGACLRYASLCRTKNSTIHGETVFVSRGVHWLHRSKRPEIELGVLIIIIFPIYVWFTITMHYQPLTHSYWISKTSSCITGWG